MNSANKKGVTDESGSLLIVALWTLLIISILAMSVSYGARLGLKLAGYRWDEVRLAQGAKAGVAFCAALCRGQGALVTALNQPWSAEEPRLQYGLEDEEGKINLNNASPGTLARVFQTAPECVAPLLDWRDADSAVRPGGAEAEYYASLPSPYPCRNGPLKCLPELLLIKGMNAEIYHGVENVVTVYGSGKININTAGPEVLGFIGMPPALIRKLMAFRAGQDRTIGTKDDGVFTNLAGIVGELDGREQLSGEEKSFLSDLVRDGGLTVQSRFFRGSFAVHLDDSRAERKFKLVFSSDNGRIISWEEQ